MSNILRRIITNLIFPQDSKYIMQQTLNEQAKIDRKLVLITDLTRDMLRLYKYWKKTNADFTT